MTARRLSPDEVALRERFEATFRQSQHPVMLSIEREVCGCAYGGNSWTTRAEAERIATLLNLNANKRLLDLGSGTGWPGLYMAELTGCEAILVDLPIAGMEIASARADLDGIGHCAWPVIADAAALPLAPSSVDAISHSDLLCCLPHKREVLSACSEVVTPGGRMAFTVISIAPGLSTAQQQRARDFGPDYIASEQDYASLLAETGWNLLVQEDITPVFTDACRRQLAADLEHAEDLRGLIGDAALTERLERWREKIVVLEDGLQRREMFLVEHD